MEWLSYSIQDVLAAIQTRVAFPTSSFQYQLGTNRKEGKNLLIKGKNMNWLTKRLADQSQYYTIFIGMMGVYSLVCCFVFHWAIEAHPHRIRLIGFLLFLGAAVLAYGGRIIHNLCYRWSLDNKDK
jgi:hypothetical protein